MVRCWLTLAQAISLAMPPRRQPPAMEPFQEGIISRQRNDCRRDGTGPRVSWGRGLTAVACRATAAAVRMEPSIVMGKRSRYAEKTAIASGRWWRPTSAPSHTGQDLVLKAGGMERDHRIVSQHFGSRPTLARDR